ncbi:MAG: NfeD family protein [Ruminococcus sp.]|nr:NfeD family protein [Ruminococcus sp.]
MNEWWEGLSTLLKVLYCIAIPSTILLLLQTLLAVFGAHHGGAGTDISDTSGIDFHGDFHADIGGHDFVPDVAHDGYIDGGDPGDFATMHLFTLQTIMAFLTVFSWSTIVCVHGGMPSGLAFGIGFAIGVIVMIALAKIVQLSARLAENGTFDLRNTLGMVATVYIPIPPKGQGEGKVTLTVQGQFRELSAVSSEEAPLSTGAQVRITDLRGDTVVVEKEE